MNWGKYILDVIKRNECVIVPGFGAFIAHKIPATHKPATHQLLPPSIRISFNRALRSNDALLINHIAMVESISYSEAQSRTQAAVTSWNQALDQKETIVFRGIGKIIRDDAGKDLFIPQTEVISSLSAYGLHELVYIPIDRTITERSEAIKKQMPTMSIHRSSSKKLEKQRREASRKRKYAFAFSSFVILAIACIQLLLFTNAPLHIQEASFISFITNPNIPIEPLTLPAYHLPQQIQVPQIETITPEPINKATEITTEQAISNKPSSSTTIDATSPDKGYFIVFGCFANAANANKLNTKLQSQGLNTHTKYTNQKTWVVLYAGNTTGDAAAALHNAKAIQTDVWVKKVK